MLFYSGCRDKKEATEILQTYGYHLKPSYIQDWPWVSRDGLWDARIELHLGFYSIQIRRWNSKGE